MSWPFFFVVVDVIVVVVVFSGVTKNRIHLWLGSHEALKETSILICL